MASTNQSPFYKKAESMFLQAKTNDEKLRWFEEMIRECPKHKSSEKMLANLKTRHIKLKEKIESQKKASKGFKKKGIKKEDMQAVIIGFSNAGKSSILSSITNAKPFISEIKFSTTVPQIGIMNYNGVQVQIIENPSIDSEYYDRGLTNSADTLIIVITSLDEIKNLVENLEKVIAKKIFVFNKSDKLNENEKRKIESTLLSKKYNFVLISAENEEGLEYLKEKIFKSFDKIRVYTKEPGKEKSNKPVILSPDSTVKDVAEKILKGYTQKVKETRIWGPSSKFPGQIVGLTHKLKDSDIVEFKTK